MSVGVVNKSTGDRIQTAGDPLDKVGNLANLTTSAKANAVEAINEVNATKANQAQLATVEASTTASKAYSAGEYLVLGGVLYKVTANIAQGGTIVTEGAGKNVDLATVGGELSGLNSKFNTMEEITSSITFYGIEINHIHVYRYGKVVVVSGYAGMENAASGLVQLMSGLPSIPSIDLRFDAWVTENNVMTRRPLFPSLSNDSLYVLGASGMEVVEFTAVYLTTA